MTDATEFIALLKKFDALRDDDQILTDTVDRIEPQYQDDWPTELHPAIREALSSIGISKPYGHQYNAISRSLSGVDVVLESPTASGKTLAFTVPMLHALKSDPNSHAMMIYPMKALAFDQRAQIQEICRQLSIESWPYDGDTSEEHKKLLKSSPPRVLLTNPEYLNASFLGWRELWDGFLKNLQYIVIDEMHEYRGFFGSNMALLLRRFFLYLNRIGVSPQVFLSTATCANPMEHAKNLTGREIEVISGRNSFRPRRHFVFVRPDVSDFRYLDILRLRVENAALTVLSMELQALIFCPSKKFLEDAFRNSKRRAIEQGIDPDRISVFHADMKSEDRQYIQQRIRSGDTRVVFTTNALELGLDIGGLDAIILAGFPPSTMSAWQQIGRAGRGWDRDALVLFYAMNDPIDRFFVSNLSAFLNKPFDELVVDPANTELIGKHIPSLMSETEGILYPTDEATLGNPFYVQAFQNRGTPPPRDRPQRRLNMRGGTGRSFSLKQGNDKIGQISAIRRFREAYIGAIFTFMGRRYRVHSHEEGAVVLVSAEQNRRTEPRFFTALSSNETIDGAVYGDIGVYFGRLNLWMNFTGYRLIDEGSEEDLGSAGTEASINQDNLHSVWIDVPRSHQAVEGIGALGHLIRVGAMFVIPADRFDTSTYSTTSDEPRAYYYENYPGGIGVAKKLFDVWPNALEKGIDIAINCSCARGCQNCIEPAKSYDISNANIDKLAGIELARHILTLKEKGPDRIFKNGLMVPV